MTCILSLKRRISHMNRQENRLRNYRKKAKGFSIHILTVRNVFVILSEVCGNKELKSSHNYCKKAQDILTSQMKGYQSKRFLSYWTMSSSLIHNLNINQRKKMISPQAMPKKTFSTCRKKNSLIPSFEKLNFLTFIVLLFPIGLV